MTVKSGYETKPTAEVRGSTAVSDTIWKSRPGESVEGYGHNVTWFQRDCNVGRECRAGLREGLHRDLYGAVGNGTGVLVTEMQEKDRWGCVWEV